VSNPFGETATIGNGSLSDSSTFELCDHRDTEGNDGHVDDEGEGIEHSFRPQSLYQSDMIRFIGSVRAHHKADQLHVVEVDDTQVACFMNTSFVGNSATLGGALYISRSCAYLLLLVLYCCP